jgi:hypothetical protein
MKPKYILTFYLQFVHYKKKIQQATSVSQHMFVLVFCIS